MPIDKRIPIGEDHYIDWIDFDPIASPVFRVDDLNEPLGTFWGRLEIDCMALCCGVDAFNFMPDTILQRTTELDWSRVTTELKSLREQVQQLAEPIVVSGRLNQLFEKSVYLRLLDHLIDTLTTHPGDSLAK